MKKRIWELDAARGLALLGMLVIHFLYDLVDLWQVFSWQEPGWYCFINLRMHACAPSLHSALAEHPFPYRGEAVSVIERTHVFAPFAVLQH